MRARKQEQKEKGTTKSAPKSAMAKLRFNNSEILAITKVLLSNFYTVGMWDKDLVNAPNLKVSWLWLVDPPQNQQDCTFLLFVQIEESTFKVWLFKRFLSFESEAQYIFLVIQNLI